MKAKGRLSQRGLSNDRFATGGARSPWALSSPSGWLCSGSQSSSRGHHERRFDLDAMDIGLHGDVRSCSGSSISNLSDEDRDDSKAITSGLVVVDVLAGNDHEEDIILAPNVHKLPENSLVKVILQSNNERVVMYCSADILKMKSPFFGNILTEQEVWRPKDSDSHRLSPKEIASSGQGMWRSPIVLAESYPYEAAALLENIHENYLMNALSWNSTFCRLSVVWALDEFIDTFAHLIDSHFEKCIHFVKSSNWRTNACLLEGMDVAVFSSDIGIEPILLTGKIVVPESRIEYSSVRCALDASDIISATPRKHSLASPVFTDTELNTCVSVSSPTHGITDTPVTFDQRNFLTESLLVNVKEPFWVMADATGGKWMSPDEFCLSSKKLEVPQGDKRKFWEMIKLLHELPILNKRCKNRIKTAEQVAELFRRKEFTSLWSAEAADCLTSEALMKLASVLLEN